MSAEDEDSTEDDDDYSSDSSMSTERNDHPPTPDNRRSLLFNEVSDADDSMDVDMDNGNELKVELTNESDEHILMLRPTSPPPLWPLPLPQPLPPGIVATGTAIDEHELRSVSLSDELLLRTDEINDEDRFKPVAELRLEIKSADKFLRNTEKRVFGAPEYARGVPWRLMALSHLSIINNDSDIRALGVFVECNMGREQKEGCWSCQASAVITLLPNEPAWKQITQKYFVTFGPTCIDYGFNYFAHLDPRLLGEALNNNKISLKAVVAADAPHCLDWDSKKLTGYVGLKNQGATCYLNSVLQTFFFTTQLRKGVYGMPTQDADSETSVALSLQRVFYGLQTASTAVCTRQLTQSFGWDASDSFHQHDVQELCRVLLDNIERHMAGTEVDGTVPKLFKGEMKSYVKCVDVDFVSSRSEPFYDIQLNVSGKRDVLEAFAAYTAEETLEGENAFDAGKFGMQRAVKGVKFVSLPLVLHLQLMRFQYSAELDANVKINDRFEFPEVLNLENFVEEKDPGESYEYVLHAVLVHAGNSQFGHYTVFINTEINVPGTEGPTWCKFDDDLVFRVTANEAISLNYGGSEDPRRIASAYMLVYVKKNRIDEVLCKISDEDVPASLRERFESEILEENRRKEERLNAKLYANVAIFTEEALFSVTDTEFAFEEIIEHAARVKLRKTAPLSELFDRIASDYNLKKESFRLWAVQEVRDSPPRALFPSPSSRLGKRDRLRPCFLLHNDELADMKLTCFLMPYHTSTMAVLLELPTDSMVDSVSHLIPCGSKDDKLIYLRYFDYTQGTLFYMGHLIVDTRRMVNSYMGTIRQMARLGDDIPLMIYREIPCKSRRLNLSETFSANFVYEHGDLLIVEREDKWTEDYNAMTYLCDEEDCVTVRGITHERELEWAIVPDFPRCIFSIAHLRWSLRALAQAIAREVGCDQQRILFWKMRLENGRITACDAYYRESELDVTSVEDLLRGVKGNLVLHRHRYANQFIYSKMRFPIVELRSRRVVRLCCMNLDMHIVTRTVFPREDETVQSILNEARIGLPFGGSKPILRLVHMVGSPPRLLKLVDPRTKISRLPHNWNLRVEEVPEDEVDLKPDEIIVTVAHYDKDPSNLFGIPFLMRIKHGERFEEICKRLQSRLKLRDAQFAKLKFTAFFDDKFRKELSADDTVDLSMFSRLSAVTSPCVYTPWLGINHVDKERSPSSTEKPIIIHN